MGHRNSALNTFTKLDRPILDVLADYPQSRLLCPRPHALPSGAIRLYYVEKLPDAPATNNGVIVSAFSEDGRTWQRDPGIRVGIDGENWCRRVLSPDIHALPDGRLRMYFEEWTSCGQTDIFSAISDDGLTWTREAGVRISQREMGGQVGTPCAVDLPDGRVRLYFHNRRMLNTCSILSAVSPDGLSFEIETGERIRQERPEEMQEVYAPTVTADPTCSKLVMLYSGWALAPDGKGRILSAESRDGLNWTKHPDVVLEPDNRFDMRHCSEPALLKLKDGRHLLFYEACGIDNKWRIMAAFEQSRNDIKAEADRPDR